MLRLRLEVARRTNPVCLGIDIEEFFYDSPYPGFLRTKFAKLARSLRRSFGGDEPTIEPTAFEGQPETKV